MMVYERTWKSIVDEWFDDCFDFVDEHDINDILSGESSGVVVCSGVCVCEVADGYFVIMVSSMVSARPPPLTGIYS